MGVVDAVRGMRDLLPRDVINQAFVQSQIEQVLAQSGYLPIDLPIIEQRDLYLRKLGEELVGKVYEFSFNGRELALRPEWTASVLRVFVSRMQDQPLPLRLRYCGPVFRNERPQRHTYRQFTQLGTELLGAPSPRADAECLALACAGLDAAGVRGYRVRIGHIGLIRQVLSALGLNERTQSYLAWSLERLRKQGIEPVREQLATMQGETPPLAPEQIAGLDDAQAEALLLHALRAMGVNLRYGTRPPEAIVGRLVRKLRREEQPGQLEHALTLLEQLSHIHGPPEAALQEATELLTRYQLPAQAIAELQAILELVVAHGIPYEQIVVDFGLGRGLNYYTGIIFEIYDADELQVCGGGRYDDLVTALGGRQPIPAIGFAYGLERVVAAANQPQSAPARELLVAATEPDAYPAALMVAQELRQRGWIVQVDIRGRTTTNNLRDAERRGLAAVVLVKPAISGAPRITWRELPSRAEHMVVWGAWPEV